MWSVSIECTCDHLGRLGFSRVEHVDHMSSDMGSGRSHVGRARSARHLGVGFNAFERALGEKRHGAAHHT